MPIYAYRCERCGHAKDVLQKVSDPVLTVCPACGEPAFRKQVTAAGFQLKGSGWYVTDFRGDKASSKSTEAGADGEAKPADAKPADAKGADAKGADAKSADAKGGSAAAADAGGKANGSADGAKASKSDSPSATAPAAKPAASPPSSGGSNSGGSQP